MRPLMLVALTLPLGLVAPAMADEDQRSFAYEAILPPGPSVQAFWIDLPAAAWYPPYLGAGALYDWQIYIPIEVQSVDGDAVGVAFNLFELDDGRLVPLLGFADTYGVWTGSSIRSAEPRDIRLLLVAGTDAPAGAAPVRVRVSSGYAEDFATMPPAATGSGTQISAFWGDVGNALPGPWPSPPRVHGFETRGDATTFSLAARHSLAAAGYTNAITALYASGAALYDLAFAHDATTEGSSGVYIGSPLSGLAGPFVDAQAPVAESARLSLDLTRATPMTASVVFWSFPLDLATLGTLPPRYENRDVVSGLLG